MMLLDRFWVDRCVPESRPNQEALYKVKDSDCIYAPSRCMPLQDAVLTKEWLNDADARGTLRQHKIPQAA